MSKIFYNYVLLCKEKQKQIFYIGITSDLAKRIKQHKQGKTKTTSKYDMIKLVYYEACLSKADAIKRERQLKTGFGKGYIKKRIQNYLKSVNERM